MSKIVITGSQSGMCLAFRNDLEALGEEIIGIDLPGKNAEVVAGLSTKNGWAKEPFIIGQVIIADVGMEATWRCSDYPKPWNISSEILINSN